MTTTDTAARTLVDLDPADLIVGANVRLDPRMDKTFIASIRERGVIEPIIAQQDEEGRAVVIAGQRRTLAAVEVGLSTVPVVLCDTRGEIDRIIDQMAENDHRAAITDAERVAAVEQLSLLGLSAAQVAKRTATKRPQVDAALAVAQSQTAKDAINTRPGLTLTQAAALAEFDGDEDALNRLHQAIEDGRGFDFALQRSREERREREARATLTEEATSRGLTVIDRPGYGLDSPSARLDSLADADGNPLTADTHATCPGHAVFADQRWITVYEDTGEPVDTSNDAEVDTYGDDEDGTYDEDDVYGDDECDPSDEDEAEEQVRATRQVRAWTLIPACADWRAHGHQDRYGYRSHSPAKKAAADMTEAEREQAKATRALTIRCNKDWNTAEPVRRAWVTTLLTRKTPPKDVGIFLAQMLTTHRRALDGFRVGSVLDAFTGDAHKTRAVEAASDKRAQVIALAVALAACEGGTDKEDWRTPKGTTQIYLRALAAWGYDLSEVEQRAAGLWTEDEPETPDEAHTPEDDPAPTDED